MPILIKFSKPKMLLQLTSLTLKMTTTQVVETSVTVNKHSPIQDYVHADDQTQRTFNTHTVDNKNIQTEYTATPDCA